MSRPIVYIQDQHPNSTETFVQSEIRELLRRDYEVKVLTYKKNKDYAQKCGYEDRIVALGETWDGVATDAGRDWMVQKVKEINPCYLHSHFVTESRAHAFPIAERLQIPFGFTAHAYDIWLRGARLEPEVLQQLGAHPLCVTVACEGSNHKKYLKHCGIPEEKLLVTPNSVDEQILPAKKNNHSSKLKRLVMVGRPVVKKGFYVAIDAVRMLRLSGHEVELEIVGGIDRSKPLGEHLEQYVSHFPFVFATPMLSHQETLEKIKEADALLMPSIIAENGDSDGIPTVLAEAMLLKVPVIASNVGSISDLVVPNKSGFLVKGGDVADLVEKILMLMEHYAVPSELSMLLERAYSHAKQQEIQSSANALCAHLEKVIGSFR